MKKVELLAPAGNYEALTGAIMAGADAVYLGGSLFGARAYADNFTEEEICRGIRFAHLYGCKIYLTVNTLIKEREFSKLYDYLLPYYQAGLDGVIIQDFGVFQYIKKHFPGLSLHVSTQMTVTGVYGAKLLKAEGAERIVPARELSLSEIKAMKDEADIEIETFVHGAMCYCYSGQCLFSSILGGRSGNRGRCAQPCRLPYRIEDGKEEYPLSMKDMCTIEMLPELIEAGIDSFKIEGRMKKPEYAAGVTAIYRKYIDLYEKNPNNYKVSEEDLQYLRSLYIRSEIMDGYYHKHNGSEMITIDSPAYSGSDETLLSQIRTAYIEKKKLFSVSAFATFFAEKPCELTLLCGDVKVTVQGAVVQKALKQPLLKEKIKEQLLKSGNTCFEISSLKVDVESDIFLPVSALNQLRRDAILALENAIIVKNGLAYSERTVLTSVQKSLQTVSGKKNYKFQKEHEIHVLVTSKEQLAAALSEGVKRIYLDRKIACKEAFLQIEAAFKAHSEREDKEKEFPELYLAFPYIVRSKDEAMLTALYALLQEEFITGALVRNLETVSFLMEKGNTKPIVTDAGLYMFNKAAADYLQSISSEQYLPIELNRHEIKDLQAVSAMDSCGQVVYGRLPLMLSANCLKKTKGLCRHEAGYLSLTDRYQKEFPVYTDCTYCYNILYNSVPLSLHSQFGQRENGIYTHRLDFTIENKQETSEIICYFKDLAKGIVREPDYRDFTTGHNKRGVE